MSMNTIPINKPFDWLSDLRPAHAAAASWHNGEYLRPTVMHVAHEPDGPFTIACGADLFAAHIRRFRITPPLIERLGQTTDSMGRSVFHESFLNFLQRLRLGVDLFAAPEGSVLLPNEPLLVAMGPLAHIQLLESAFRLLFWESSHWATKAAMQRWETGALTEEDTPPEPTLDAHPLSWRIRAAFIGGASQSEMDTVAQMDAPAQDPGEGTLVLRHADSMPLVQIRRLYQGSTALGDVWLTAKQEDRASVSRSSCSFECENARQAVQVHFNRFRNLYEPLLVKGLPVISSPKSGYLRQRTLQHLSALREVGPEAYPYGWMSE
jgi:hypothetical protein